MNSPVIVWRIVICPPQVKREALRRANDEGITDVTVAEAPGIHPPVQEFEALLAGSGRLKEERA